MEKKSIKGSPKKVFVAFLDILGFSSLVDNNDTEYLLNLYQDGILDTQESLKAFWETEEWREHVKGPKIQVLTVSDSVIIYTEGNGLDSFLKILSYVHAFVNHLMQKGLPLRGAITYDDLAMINSIDSKVLLGKSIVKAARLEKDQEWAGCVIDESCFKRFDYNHSVTSPLKALLEGFIPLGRYKVPFKNSKTKQIDFTENFVINWPLLYDFSNPFEPQYYLISEEEIKAAFCAHKKCDEKEDDSVTKKTISTKVQNTLDFQNHISKMLPIKPSFTRRELTDELMERYKHKDF